MAAKNSFWCVVVVVFDNQPDIITCLLFMNIAGDDNKLHFVISEKVCNFATAFNAAANQGASTKPGA